MLSIILKVVLAVILAMGMMICSIYLALSWVIDTYRVWLFKKDTNEVFIVTNKNEVLDFTDEEAEE